MDRQARSKPVATFASLRKRVLRLFSSVRVSRDPRQFPLSLDFIQAESIKVPTSTLEGFVEYLASAVPQGNVYLFGGVLRDIALFGRRGFSSDVDIVVEGGWDELARYLESIGGNRNRFGGFRLFAGDWPIDVWSAEETWAVRNGLVRYDGISSLTKTTVLNWDAILMNWRTGGFVCAPDYLELLNQRCIEVVLEDNPNPIGMAVRVFRHLSMKDARKVGPHAARYLERVAGKYSFDELMSYEKASYGRTYIEPSMYRLFSLSRQVPSDDVLTRFASAVSKLESAGDHVGGKQLELSVCSSLYSEAGRS